jgi:hypothetical protein
MIEMFLSIASFAISVGGLVSIFAVKHRRKEVVFAIVVAALVATTGVALYQDYRQGQLITQVQSEILEKLSHETLTFDQLYQELLYRPLPVVNEALSRAIEKGEIGHRVIDFQKDGKTLAVRCYFVE